MQKTLNQLRCYTGQFRVWFGLFMLVLAGFMFALSASAWYFTNQLEVQQRSFNRQINRLTKDIDLERKINRQMLESVIARSDRITDDIGVLTTKLDKTSTTAKQAARTAESAAKNAAQANITKRITEPLPKSEPKYVEPSH